MNLKDMTRCHGRINEQDCNEREQCQRWRGLKEPAPHIMRVIQKIGMKSSMDEVCQFRIAL
jgi:hypothetical protein